MKKSLLLCTLGLIALSGIAMQGPASTPSTAQKATVMLIMGLKIEYTKLKSDLEAVPVTVVTRQEVLDRTTDLQGITARAQVAYNKIAPYSQPMATAFQKIIDDATARISIIATAKTLPQ